jgi:hypothetical protein
MINRVTHGGDRLIVKFKYHPKILNAMRTVDGRRFDPSKNTGRYRSKMSSSAWTLSCR